jgi:hypothetical protein
MSGDFSPLKTDNEVAFFFDATRFPKQHHFCWKVPRFGQFVLPLRRALKTNLSMNHWRKSKVPGENPVTVHFVQLKPHTERPRLEARPSWREVCD